MNAFTLISRDLGLKESNVKAALDLLDQGATIPFISRYRKERTGGLDEVQLGDIQDAYKAHVDLEKRREFILGSIKEQGVLTEDLKKQKDLLDAGNLWGTAPPMTAPRSDCQSNPWR